MSEYKELNDFNTLHAEIMVKCMDINDLYRKYKKPYLDDHDEFYISVDPSENSINFVGLNIDYYTTTDEIDIPFSHYYMDIEELENMFECDQQAKLERIRIKKEEEKANRLLKKQTNAEIEKAKELKRDRELFEKLKIQFEGDDNV
jgi:hypothetical protein